MLMLVRCAALAACFVVSPPLAPVQDVTVNAQTGECVLQFDEQAGEKLEDVLILFQKLLNESIDYQAPEVSSVILRVSGPQQIATDKLRDYLDSLLERHGFWVWDDVSGGHPQIIVRRRSGPGTRVSTKPPFTPRLVTLQELEAGPHPRLPMYTAEFPIQHLQARDLLAVFMTLLDPSMETARCVEGSNRLLITGTRDHLLQARDTLARIDVPTAGAPDESRLAKFDQRLASIEARVTALEAAAKH